MKTTTLLAIALFSFGVSCGAAKSEGSQPMIDATAKTPQTLPQKAIHKETKAVAPEGMILRSDLKQVLEAGPGALLRRVMTEPAKTEGRFIGFRITEFTNGKPSTIDLCIGDVILMVNGRKIERPEHYFEVFQELKVASELRFVVLRQGVEQTLSYPIVD